MYTMESVGQIFALCTEMKFALWIPIKSLFIWSDNCLLPSRLKFRLINFAHE